MKENLEKAKPILFNTEMVRAILDGKKTETRRVVTPQPEFRNGETGFYILMDDGSFELKIDGYEYTSDYPITPKYYRGDILYVRETFIKTGTDNPKYFYKADCHPSLHHLYKFSPSLHMPKEAARLFLRVTDVRAERLQEIDEVGTAKEGIRTDVLTCRFDDPDFVENIGGVPIFAKLWDSTVRKDAIDKFGWDANPWVFVYSFERI